MIIKNMDIEKEIILILEKNLDKKKYSYFLFGSRAIGNQKLSSDYDIGILGDEKIEFQKYLKIKRELDEKINYNIDLVDFFDLDSEFRKIAFKKIKIWNRSKNTKFGDENF